MCLVLALGVVERPTLNCPLLSCGRDVHCLVQPSDHPLLVPSPPLLPGLLRELERGDRRIGHSDLVVFALSGGVQAASWEGEGGKIPRVLSWE